MERVRAFLSSSHQEKFNDRGQTRWQGRIYSSLPAYRSLFKSVIYHGRWGGSAFPSVYQGGVNSWTCIPQMVEWQIMTAAAVLGNLLILWLLPIAAVGRSHAVAMFCACVGNARTVTVKFEYLTFQIHLDDCADSTIFNRLASVEG
jgi:hypothetical protein